MSEVFIVGVDLLSQPDGIETCDNALMLSAEEKHHHDSTIVHTETRAVHLIGLVLAVSEHCRFLLVRLVVEPQ